ncbi:TetR/AcrR family transcriptional regulator [Paenibacillus sp. NAIST15-1]|uniref:TetR/AcrR family transcriptional regulator n=1 Tax=Paenibacillus sp. NAIST15-1 TaxID=1605994 RepID=UPI00086C94CB|nr:TetR/AcrR family transcriptional regulator [Paenibacillus sp. NAIST15-1]GAV13476.1 transcriptional regulator, TetR [Paenibacillus sp. NAIST15-1]
MSNSQKTEDRRIKRTRRIIKEAFITLIAEKGLEALTVQDIIARADMNRSTFYYHFQDKQDLLQRSIQEMMKQAMEDVELHPASADQFKGKQEHSTYDPTPKFIRLFQHIDRNRDFYKVMLEHVPGFMWTTIEMIKENMSKDLTLLQSDPSKLKVHDAFLINYSAGAYMMVIKAWLDQELPFSVDYMAKQLTQIMRNGMYAVAGIQV